MGGPTGQLAQPRVRDRLRTCKQGRAGRITILWYIMLPMTRAAFATIATIYSLWIWNDFLFPLAYIRSAANFTVPLGLGFFQEGYTTFWGDLVAAICIAVREGVSSMNIACSESS